MFQRGSSPWLTHFSSSAGSPSSLAEEMRCRVVIPISGGERIQHVHVPLVSPVSSAAALHVTQFQTDVPGHSLSKKTLRRKNLLAAAALQKGETLAILHRIPFNQMKHTKNFVTSWPWPARMQGHLRISQIGTGSGTKKQPVKG